MGWQYSSAGLGAGSQPVPLVGRDGASTSSASNTGNQRDATGPRCRVGRSQVHRGISEIDGRPNLGPFCREPKMAPGQVCPVAGRRSACATLKSRLPVLPAVETDRRQPQKSFCRELARQYGRYGYRKIAALLRQAGWSVSDGRIERIWKREGLRVPAKQPKRGRLWLTDGSCIRLRPERANHVWSYDFVEDRTHDGRRFRMLNVIDEFTHECLAIHINRKLKAIDVIDVLSDLFILRGIPGHIRSDNGPEFVAKAVQEWIAAVGPKTAYIEPGR